MIDRLRNGLRDFTGVARVHEALADLYEQLERMKRPAPAPAPLPFVCVLVVAEGPDGRLTTCGASARVQRRETIEIKPWWPLRNVMVTVFCDLDRVRVWGISRGFDRVVAGFGTCPVARFDDLPMGVILSVECEAE